MFKGWKEKRSTIHLFLTAKIQTFSVETAGVMDRDCELEIYISSIGKIHFEMKGGFDIVTFNKAISEFTLK